MPATGAFMTYLDQFHESIFVLWCVRKFVYSYTVCLWSVIYMHGHNSGAHISCFNLWFAQQTTSSYNIANTQVTVLSSLNCIRLYIYIYIARLHNNLAGQSYTAWIIMWWSWAWWSLRFINTEDVLEWHVRSYYWIGQICQVDIKYKAVASYSGCSWIHNYCALIYMTIWAKTSL